MSTYTIASTKPLNLQEALKMVGDQNTYQFRIIAILCFLNIIQSFQIMGPTYLFIEPQLLCNGQPCEQYNNYCSKDFEITFDPRFRYKNLVTDYELYCVRKNYIAITTSMAFLGSFIGGTTMSFLGVLAYFDDFYQDKYGRRRAFIISQTISVLGVIGSLFKVNILWYCFMTMIVGFGLTPNYILMILIVNEICGEEKRQKYSIIVLLSWSIGQILIALLYYGITDWRVVYGIFIGGPSIIGLMLCYFIEETPHYYLGKQNYKLALQMLDQIATVNKKETLSELLEKGIITLEFDCNSITNVIDNSNNEKNQTKKTYLSWIDLFRFPSLKQGSVGFMIVVFALHVLYYGNQFGLRDISKGETLFLLGGALGFAELIGNLIMHRYINRLPRKSFLFISFMLSIVCCCLFFFYGFTSSATRLNCQFCTACKYKNDNTFIEVMIVLITSLLRIANTFGFGIQGIYANEFYPTVIRSIGTGFVFSIGIIGSFVAPYLIEFSEYFDLNPYFAFALVGLCGPVSVFLIRETLNQPLKEQIMETELKPHLNEFAQVVNKEIELYNK